MKSNKMTIPAKRFWTDVSLQSNSEGFAINLDGRTVKTPKGHALRIPTEALGRAIRDEWAAQEDSIIPDSMPMFKLTVTAIDRVAPQRDAVVDELVNYGGSDLLCYRADDPILAAHQDEIWQSYLIWAEQKLGISLTAFTGIMPKNQPAAALMALRDQVMGYNNFQLSGLHCLTAVGGSLILALAASQDHQPIDAITKAAQLDELWQQEKWGYDDEADARIKSNHLLMTKAHQYLTLLKT
jgi:chaperone required for assembly of F1-ATPase